MSAFRISSSQATDTLSTQTPNSGLVVNPQLGRTPQAADSNTTDGRAQTDTLYNLANTENWIADTQETSEGYPVINPGSLLLNNGVANISVGVQNAGWPGPGNKNFPDNQAHTYIAIQWQDGGTTILQSGKSDSGQSQEENYPVNVGNQQTASAANNWTGGGTVTLSLGSQASANQFAQNLIDAYANFNSNSSTNPGYFIDGVDDCNTTTYDSLIVARASRWALRTTSYKVLPRNLV